jgi:hypothetical protein
MEGEAGPDRGPGVTVVQRGVTCAHPRIHTHHLLSVGLAPEPSDLGSLPVPTSEAQLLGTKVSGGAGSSRGGCYICLAPG